MRTWIRGVRRRTLFRLRDRAANRRCGLAPERVLVVRHPALRPSFYDAVLAWLAERRPEIRARFELRLLPVRGPVRPEWRLLAPWLQDPVAELHPRAYRQALDLEARFAAAGRPTVNRVARLGRAAKSETAARLAAAGIRTPRTVPIADAAEFRRTLNGLAPPLLIREDLGHASADAVGQGDVVRCDDAAAARAVDLSRFRHPVGMEFVETRDPRDGLYRKYRCAVAGDAAIPIHLMAKEHWFVKGEGQLFTDAIVAQDRAYLSGPDPHAATFVQAARVLELDFVAFDYGYDPAGRLVVWEANPFPYLHFLPARRAYRTPAVERTILAMSRLLLGRAGLSAPEIEAMFVVGGIGAGTR